MNALTWITVTPAPVDNWLALRFPYDLELKDALKRDFGYETACLRWNPDERCWMLKRSQFDALCAVFGDRLSVHADVWAKVFPARAVRRRPARQRDIWGGSVAAERR